MKGMTVHLYRPEVVTKAALPLLAGSIGTCQYPDARSNVENHSAPDRADKESSICGRGYASLMDVAFTFL